MQLDTDTGLIEAARRIAVVIRDYKDEAERENRLSAPVLAALHDAGLLRMCTPKSLGGLETDPLTRALVIEEITAYDTAAGWTLANPLDWAYLCARLPDAGAEEIYAHGPNILIAAQFGRPMRAEPAGGGYRITGRAPFVSNCHDANWIATTAIVMDGDTPQTDGAGQPVAVMAYLPADNCNILDTWHVLGMRGTGSHDIEVADVFVPTTLTFPMAPDPALGSHYKGPLYRFPLVGTVATNLPPVVIAVARQAIDTVVGLRKAKCRSSRRRPYASARRPRPPLPKRRRSSAPADCCFMTR